MAPGQVGGWPHHCYAELVAEFGQYELSGEDLRRQLEIIVHLLQWTAQGWSHRQVPSSAVGLRAMNSDFW